MGCLGRLGWSSFTIDFLKLQYLGFIALLIKISLFVGAI